MSRWSDLPRMEPSGSGGRRIDCSSSILFKKRPISGPKTNETAVHIVKKSIHFMCVPPLNMNGRVPPPQPVRERWWTCGNLSEGRMSGTERLCLIAASPMKAGRQKNGKGRSTPGSCAGPILQGIQIRPQFMPGNARDALDLQHPQRGNFIPLRNGLLADV